jgi:hypothetical protein
MKFAQRFAPRAHYGALVLCIPLALLAGMYWGLGLYRLAFADTYPNARDYMLRYYDARYFVAGIDPTLPTRELESIPLPMKSYPPWSLAMMPGLAPFESWSLSRLYFAGLNILAMGYLCWYFYQQIAPHGRSWGALAALSFLACVANLHCLSNGQFAILLTAMIAGALVALDRGHQGLGGILLGFALLKPQIAGLFVLIPFVRRQWLAVGIAASIVGLFTGLAGFWVHANPWEMFKRSTQEGLSFADLSQNPIVLAAQSVGGSSPGTLTLLALGTIVCLGILTILHRRLDTLTLMGIVAFISMFWSYRKNYDVVLLSFLVIATLRIALDARRPAPWLMFGMLAVPLWIPIRFGDLFLLSVQSVFAAIWSVAGLWLVTRGLQQTATWKGVADSVVEGTSPVDFEEPAPTFSKT